MQSTFKMSAFLGMLILFYSGFGAVIYWQLTNFADLVESLHDHPMTVTKSTLTANRNVLAVSRNVKDMLLVDDPIHRRKRLIEIELYEKDTDQNINLVLERIEGEEGKTLVEKAIEQINAQKILRERITNAIAKGDMPQAAELARVDGTALMKQLEETMVKIANYSDSRSMEYHVQSVNDLRRAKITLFSAGLIVLILSSAFAVTSWRALQQSLWKTRATLRKAKELPIDLTQVFDSSSLEEIGDALNNFFKEVYSIVEGVNLHHAAFKQPLYELHDRQKRSISTFNDIIKNIDDIFDKAGLVINLQQEGYRGFQLPFELLKQVKGDLNLIAQIAATKDLLIEKLKIETGSVHIGESKIAISLASASTSMRDNIERTNRSVTSVIDILQSLLNALNDLRVATLSQESVLRDLHAIRDSDVASEALSQKLLEISDQLERLLKNFKLT